MADRSSVDHGGTQLRTDHRKKRVGPWAKLKLSTLEKYLSAYCTALKNKRFKRIYIDAFAGACLSEVRAEGQAGSPRQNTILAEDPETAEAQAEFINGSPIRALGISPGFQHHYFFDMDQSRVQELAAATQGRSDVTIKVGDCNPLIRALAPKLTPPSVRGVAFLDPYGPHLDWATIEALAATKNMEVIINFPLGMAINRLITRDGAVPANWGDSLDRCFGTPAWREIAYVRTPDLFGDQLTVKRMDVAEQLKQLYLGRLKDIFRFVPEPLLVTNTRGAPLYYLIWAGQNARGKAIANDILRRNERLARSIVRSR